MIDLVSELKSVVAAEYGEIIDDIVKTEGITTKAELILRLCKIVTKEIEIVEREKYFPWIQQMGKVYGRKKNKNLGKEAENRLMVYGAQLIYILRSFIQDEEITFHMASKTVDGKYEASAFIPQSQILKSMSAVSGSAIGVSAALQKELIDNNKNNELFNIKRKNMWTRVEYLSEARYISGRNINKIDMRKAGAKKAHWAYQSQKKDNQIYLKFTGNRIVKYYNMSENGYSLMEFNNGWLWEWYNKILHGGTDEQYTVVNTSLMSGSLKPLMLGKDYTPGTKEGDFQDLLGRQIQSKYANSKIISFNNIRHIIYDLELALTAYIKEGKSASGKLMEVLNEHFFPESATVGNMYANEVVDKLLKKLNAGI